MSQVLSSQGKKAPSDPYPHYLVRLAASRFLLSLPIARDLMLPAKSPERTATGRELAARHRKSQAIFHRALKSQCVIAWPCLRHNAISGVRGHGIAIAKSLVVWVHANGGIRNGGGGYCMRLSQKWRVVVVHFCAFRHIFAKKTFMQYPLWLCPLVGVTPRFRILRAVQIGDANRNNKRTPDWPSANIVLVS